MNTALLAAAVALLALGLAAYPPGPSPAYPLPDETVSVTVPPRLVAAGYPPTISVSRAYLEERFGGSYALLVNATFRPDGVYDYAAGRIIAPGEAWTRVVGRSDRVAVNYVKVAMLSSAVVLMAAAVAWAGGGGSRAEPAGGYVP